MTRVAIIGAGQAGSLAAVGLMNAGYEVSLYSDRTADSILNDTAPTGTAYIFGDSVAVERKHGVETFEDVALPADGIHLYFNPKVGQELVQISGELREHTGYAVDVRLKTATRMAQLEAGGAQVIIEHVTPERLDGIAEANDVTLVATGKADLANMFERDSARSVYDKPQRYLAMAIVKNVATDGTGFPNRMPGFTPVCFNFYGDIGEFFWVPFYHKTEGQCWNMVLEAKTDSPLDTYRDVTTGDEMMDRVREIVRTYAPWDWETMKNMELVDNDAHPWLRGAFPPTVRKPVAHTESGHAIWALGDTSFAFDPIGGQGAVVELARPATTPTRSSSGAKDRSTKRSWIRPSRSSTPGTAGRRTTSTTSFWSHSTPSESWSSSPPSATPTSPSASSRASTDPGSSTRCCLTRRWPGTTSERPQEALGEPPT